MLQKLKYKCTVCDSKLAILRCIFVTKSKKFRAKFHCHICKNNFEITVGGKNWKHLEYSNKEIIKQIDLYINKLTGERKNAEV